MDPEVWREGKEEKEGNAMHDTAEEMLLISTELDDVTLAELSKTPKSKRISWHSSCTVSLSLSSRLQIFFFSICCVLFWMSMMFDSLLTGREQEGDG